MEVIGITGSSGSGKTTISEIFKEKLNAKLINADKVVKEMSVLGTEYINKIEENFGKDILLKDGNLNRKLLAEKIYQDKNALLKLNNITFKYVVDEIKTRVLKETQNVNYVIIDAPLLIESELDKLCDFIIAVIADEEVKIKRICKRDGLDFETAQKRLKIQKKDDFYIKKANYVIENNEGNIEEKIEDVLKYIKGEEEKINESK